jgi:hypothetical protein
MAELRGVLLKEKTMGKPAITGGKPVREKPFADRPVYGRQEERAAYEESVWLLHRLFLGNRSDVDDIADAVEKV